MAQKEEKNSNRASEALAVVVSLYQQYGVEYVADKLTNAAMNSKQFDWVLDHVGGLAIDQREAVANTRNYLDGNWLINHLPDSSERNFRIGIGRKVRDIYPKEANSGIALKNWKAEIAGKMAFAAKALPAVIAIAYDEKKALSEMRSVAQQLEVPLASEFDIERGGANISHVLCSANPLVNEKTNQLRNQMLLSPIKRSPLALALVNGGTVNANSFDAASDSHARNALGDTKKNLSKAENVAIASGATFLLGIAEEQLFDTRKPLYDRVKDWDANRKTPSQGEIKTFIQDFEKRHTDHGIPSGNQENNKLDDIAKALKEAIDKGDIKTMDLIGIVGNFQFVNDQEKVVPMKADPKNGFPVGARQMIDFYIEKRKTHLGIPAKEGDSAGTMSKDEEIAFLQEAFRADIDTVTGKIEHNGLVTSLFNIQEQAKIGAMAAMAALPFAHKVMSEASKDDLDNLVENGIVTPAALEEALRAQQIISDFVEEKDLQQHQLEVRLQHNDARVVVDMEKLDAHVKDHGIELSAMPALHAALENYRAQAASQAAS